MKLIWSVVALMFVAVAIRGVAGAVVLRQDATNAGQRTRATALIVGSVIWTLGVVLVIWAIAASSTTLGYVAAAVVLIGYVTRYVVPGRLGR